MKRNLKTMVYDIEWKKFNESLISRSINITNVFYIEAKQESLKYL